MGYKNTENIDKALRILSKSLHKKYPYLGDITLKSISDEGGLMFVNIDVDYNKFLEYNDLKLRPQITYLLQQYPNESPFQYIPKEMSYLHIPLEDNKITDEKFGYRFNNGISEYLDGMLTMLPESLIPTYTIRAIISEYVHPMTFSVSGYKTTFNTEEYLNYVNK